jgi:hypothetical protein
MGQYDALLAGIRTREEELSKVSSTLNAPISFNYTTSGVFANGALPERLLALLWGYDENDVFTDGALRGKLTLSEIRDLIDDIVHLCKET